MKFSVCFALGTASLIMSTAVLSGCGSGKGTGPAPGTSSGSQVTDEKLRSALAELGKDATQDMQQTGVPGMAIAVVYKDKVVFMKGFGVRENGKSEPVTEDTVFQIASLSKPVATTVIAGLVGEGRVSWDDPVIKYLPDFQLSNPSVTQQVTLRDFLSHRSGLQDHIGDSLNDLGYSRDIVLHNLRFASLGDRFRKDYAYTNFGFTAAAVAAAKPTGMTWEDLSAERLYRPLGMTSTSSRFSDFMAMPNRAKPHVKVNGVWVAKYQRQPDDQSPAGGVSSNIRDMAQWMRLQLGNGTINGKPIINARALAETHRAQIQRPSGGPYGLGWNVSTDDKGRLRVSHSGAFALGAATSVFLIPSEQIGIIALSNGSPIGVPEAVCISFLERALDGKVSQDWLAFMEHVFDQANAPEYGTAVDYSKQPVPFTAAQPLDTYVGLYRNDFYGQIEVAAEGGRLVLKTGPALTSFSMNHWNDNTFTYQPVGEQATVLSGVTFTIGPNQKAQQVVIEDLNIQGLGTFTRIATPGT